MNRDHDSSSSRTICNINGAPLSKGSLGVLNTAGRKKGEERTDMEVRFSKLNEWIETYKIPTRIEYDGAMSLENYNSNQQE